MEKFRKLGISDDVIKSLEEHKFHIPSEIQEKAIPLVLQGKDVIGGSATGSGKTLVFGAGIIQNVERGQGVQALVLTPTRELAEQETKAIRNFSKYKHLNIAAIYGGVSERPQVEALRDAEVVVGTPGRVLDLISHGYFETKHILILVLDEADRMMDMGFIRDVDKIISRVPEERQTLMFSATIDPDIYHLAKKYMREPVEVSAEQYVDPSKLCQIFYEVPKEQKFSLLVHLLKKEHSGLVMIFCNTRRNTDFVAKNLKNSGIDALAIHGGFSQEKRTKTISSFSKGKLLVLVCTDVAARGLDIKGVSHVYNYDIPKDSKDYLHRIGRTARAGKEGKAICILSERDFENFRNVLHNPDISIERQEMPQVERVMIKIFDERGGRGFNSGFRSRENFRRDDRRSDGRGFGRNRNFSRDNQSRGFRSENRDKPRNFVRRGAVHPDYRRGDRGERSFGRRDSRDDRGRSGRRSFSRDNRKPRRSFGRRY